MRCKVVKLYQYISLDLWGGWVYEEISTDDVEIEYTLCGLYDSMEENNIDIN